MKLKKYMIIALLFIFAGCSNDWLNDVEPQGQLLESNFYQSEDEMSQGIISIYSIWKTNYWSGWTSWYCMTSFASDDAVKHGDGPSDQPQFYACQRYSSTSTSAGLLETWKRTYYGVYRANVVISRVDPTSAFGKKAIGEAKMLRAMFYFDLVRYFGSGPLILDVLTPDDYYNQVKADQSLIFDAIVQDLKDAAESLPSSWSGVEGYRMNKYGAMGLLSKVYLYMASPYYNTSGANDNLYGEAETLAQKVINEGGYELEEDFDKIWWYANQFNNETLIEMAYSPVPGDGWGDGSANPGNILGKLFGPRGIGSVDTIIDGWGMDMIVPELVELYDAEGDDIRKNATVLSEEQILSYGAKVIEKKQDYTGYYSKKRTTWRASNTLENAWGFSNNERILRLGDIYLILAEAQIMQGKSGDAALNTVRSRVTLDPIAGATMDDIKIERRLELAMENNRFFDLVRWNDALTVLGPDKPEFNKGGYKAYNAIWPIPQEEIDKTYGSITQNPGY